MGVSDVNLMIFRNYQNRITNRSKSSKSINFVLVLEHDCQYVMIQNLEYPQKSHLVRETVINDGPKSWNPDTSSGFPEKLSSQDVSNAQFPW